MIVETWIAAIILVFFFISNLALIVTGMLVEEKLENERIKNDELREENYALRRYIAAQKTKSIIGVANEYNDEGKKK